MKVKLTSFTAAGILRVFDVKVFAITSKRIPRTSRRIPWDFDALRVLKNTARIPGWCVTLWSFCVI